MSGSGGNDDEFLDVGEELDPFAASDDGVSGSGGFDDLLELEDMPGLEELEDLPAGDIPQGDIPQGAIPAGEIPQGAIPQGTPIGEPMDEIPQGAPPADSFIGRGRAPRTSGRISGAAFTAIDPNDAGTPPSPMASSVEGESQEWSPDGAPPEAMEGEGSADFADGMVDELFGAGDAIAEIEDLDVANLHGPSDEIADSVEVSDIEELLSQDIEVLNTGDFESAPPPPPEYFGSDMPTNDESILDELASFDEDALSDAGELESLDSSDDLPSLDSSDDLAAVDSSDALEAVSGDDFEATPPEGVPSVIDELPEHTDDQPAAFPRSASSAVIRIPVPEPEVERIIGGSERRDHVPAPIPDALADSAYLLDHAKYRSASRKLARSRGWEALAEMANNSLEYAQWAALPEVRSSLLLELARIYSDRLDNAEAAEQTFVRLSWEDPTNREALEYLDEVYDTRHDYRNLHDIYARAVDGTWDPGERLEHTREAVRIASEMLGEPALAIVDWEHLWSLGESGEEVSGALTDAYRKHGRWDKLATFLEKAMAELEGDRKRPHMREVAEIYLSSQRAPALAAPMIDAIRQVRPTDPVALLAQARIAFQGRDFDQLAALSRIEGIDEEVARDIRRVAADALWQAGERELAVDVYETILSQDPEDRDSLRAKERFFTESENWTALCGFLESRAARPDVDGEPSTAERVDLLERAAEIAENRLGQPDHAISLWQQRVDMGGPTQDAFRNLTSLYETTGNQNGVANSLEGLLELTHQPRSRAEILARLGEIYSHHLDDDLKGEEMWGSLLAIDPGDTHAQSELANIYKRRGDFEALDQTLARQIATAGDDEVLDLVNAAARNIQENIGDAGRSVAGWEQVLDYAPNDLDALPNLANQLGALDNKRERLAALEVQIQAAEPEDRIDLSLNLAREWSEAGSKLAAIATYERVLRWDPTEARALEQLEALASDAGAGAVRSALELASNLAEDEDTTIGRLERVLGLLDVDDHDNRLAMLRRLVSAGDEGALERLASEVDKANQHGDLAAVYLQLASDGDAEARNAALTKLAALYESKLEGPDKAFLTLASMGFEAIRHGGLLGELERLGKVTGRWEELLVIHDGLASASFDPGERRKALEARYRILAEDLSDPARAFEELRRILALEGLDDDVLQRAEKLAGEHSLSRQLLALYGQLFDGAKDDAIRGAIAGKRHTLIAEVLEDDAAALDALILCYRVDPSEELQKKLLEAAEKLDAWSVVVPRVEAAERSALMPARDELIGIAKLYEEKLDDKDRAFELYAEVLLQTPDAIDIADELQRLAEATDQRGRLAASLRAAAARASNTDSALQLYRRVASLYVEHLASPERAIDIHRRILRLAPSETTSLDALVTRHREREEWGQLRDRLQQRISCAAEDESVEALWMEIASLCREHLDDTEGALDAYSRILADNEDHEGARAGVAELTGDTMSAEVQARRLRLELNLASEEDRPDVLLSLAKLQLNELKNPGGARETLKTLVEETGAAGPGFEPFADVLERLGEWSELISLLEERAESEDDSVDSLTRALQLCDDHGADAEDIERIARKLRALEPDNQKLFERLAQTMRVGSRWEDLASLLVEAIDSADDAEQKLTFQRELARIRDLALADEEGTRKVLESIVDKYPEDLEALYHRINLARRSEDLDTYIELREIEADLVEPEWGALIYCHLAEVNDENDQKAQVAACYRKARKLHADNPVAGDALRALGRRLKNWRELAALLPDADERDLGWAERAAKLVVRGDAAEDRDVALDWYRRAIASDPDNAQGWRGMARILGEHNDAEGRLNALLGALGAFERSVKPAPETLADHARALHESAVAAIDANDVDTAKRLNARAYAIAPDFAPAALAVANALEDDGNLEHALEIFTHVIDAPEDAVDLETRDDAVFRRGRLAARLGDSALAIDDLRNTVRKNPLHEEALDALGTLHAEQGHVALALANVQQALVVAVEKQRRGELYYRIGRLWEDGIGDGEEAGIYYELALEHGAADPALMRRALDHYKRDGRHDEALAMVDELIDNTDEASTLATLWVTRGEILEGVRPDDAIEAFDMALSYEPGAGAALDGLERMLAAREEWEQLADLIEGRIETAPSELDKAQSLRRLATLAEEQLGDPDRAVESLRQVLDIEPSPEALDKLLILTEGGSAEERQDLLVHAVEYGTRRFDKAVELAQVHLKNGRRLQAWAILAPLRAIIHLEPELKETVNELRGEFEREDASQLYPFLNEARPEPKPVRDGLFEVLVRLREKMGPVGATDLEALTSGAVQVSESTPNGKLFAALREIEGIENLKLFRSVELDEDIVVVDNDEDPVVCIRTEIFQKASGGELHFWLAKALELARPEIRAVAALPVAKRETFATALLAALGLAEVPAGAQDQVDAITAVLDEELKEEFLGALEIAVEENGTGDADNFWLDSVAAAHQVSALVVSDLRAAWRALSRMHEDIPEQRAVKSLDDLNAMFDNDPRMSRLLRFYVSPMFSGFIDKAE